MFLFYIDGSQGQEVSIHAPLFHYQKTAHKGDCPGELARVLLYVMVRAGKPWERENFSWFETLWMGKTGNKFPKAIETKERSMSQVKNDKGPGGQL
ncbi:MAG: hypothetical protein KKD44_12275 [Proteobacteria bacterium]|nr:hypothetical protein [Pseudomonadota bacterium]